jgi:chemotaxis signal transduction protein
MAQGELFGVLHCAGIDIAISGAELIEVVSLSRGLMPAALVPPYVLGLHDLRGSPVPVIDVSVLLGRHAAPEKASIAAVIDHGGYRLAIAAEALGPLLRVEPGEMHPIEQTQGSYPAVLKAVLQRPGLGSGGGSSAGMVQVLDLAALLTCESLLLTRSRGRVAKAAAEPSTVYLVFTCAGRSFALPAFAVQQILQDQPVEPSPFAGGGCIGMARSRGRLVPVVDAARLLGLPTAARQQRVELVVMLTPEGAVALQVSQREDIMGWREADIAPTEAMGEVCPGLIRGLVRKDGPEDGHKDGHQDGHQDGHKDGRQDGRQDGRGGGTEVFVLDPEALAAPDVRALAKGHRDLFGKLDGREADRPSATSATTAEAPRAYLVFEAGITWLVAMEQVVEIIAAPKPTELRGALSARLGGVLIHRRRSVSFIDLCGLVGAPRGAEPHGIIVEAEGQFFGFQVSRVAATVKAAVCRASMSILSTSRSPEAELVRRHACFVYWTTAEGVRSAVLLNLRALALDAHGTATPKERLLEHETM